MIKHRSSYIGQSKKPIILGEAKVVRYHNDGNQKSVMRFAKAVCNGDVLLVPGGRDIVNKIYVGPPDHPPLGCKRLFTDASFCPITKQAFYVVVVLHYDFAVSPHFKFDLFSGQLYGVQTPTEAELDGLKHGISIALQEEYNHPIIANDCLRAVL